jgi:hypothetical protein
MIESPDYTCGQILNEFMGGLNSTEHSGGSAVTFFHVMKMAKDNWAEFLEWCIKDDNLYLGFGQETRARAKIAFEKIQG